MNILLLGSGGREHALAWKIRQSGRCSALYVAPGNAGTAQIAVNLPVSDDDFSAVADACETHAVNMVVVGPEGPLVKGIVDFFETNDRVKHIPVIGPNKAAAQLEGSKDFSKRIMKACGIPTAAYATFEASNFEEGITYIQQHSLPIVLKADGLAAGKGVLICGTREEAVQEFTEMLRNNKFGHAGTKVVIEEFLSGIEISVFAVTDGTHYQLLPSAKDYKRIGEGDTGLNTGGMGAISPVPFANATFLKKVETRIVQPLLMQLAKEGIVYKGFLFIGLMNVNGDPKVIEFNCRLGDPETEVVIPRIETDIIDILEGIANNTIHEVPVKERTDTAATVFLVSGGYPGTFEKGKQITGLENVNGSMVFHAGTRLTADNTVVTNGGRVLAITSFGNSIQEAARRSFVNAECIHYDGKYYRKDIGNDLLNLTL